MSTIAKLSLPEYERIVATGVFDGKNKRRIELIWGELREMNPIGSEHAMVLNRLTQWSFRTAGERIWLRIQDPIAISSAESEPEPDLVWAKPKDYTAHHPSADDVLLLVEVAESSLDFDRDEKAGLYATAGILDYWIVNLVDRVVEVHRNPRQRRYQSVASFAAAQSVQTLALPEARLVVDTLFGEHA
ncbi:MAG TPA: Uma2 family endonuclease [Pirellulales bacterium]|jgi:Uma2 family endonuclease|nr:Uma2 family endonuclease [Pirellulales bacterium]